MATREVPHEKNVNLKSIQLNVRKSVTRLTQREELAFERIRLVDG